MLIQFDSGYRDYTKFPYNSEFSINVNGQPPDIANKNDVRYSYLTRQYIQHAFRWVGNSSFNNPLSKVINDTFKTFVVPTDKNRCIVVPADDQIRSLIKAIDYFVGIQIWNEETNNSATAIIYDSNYNVVTFDRDIFSFYFSNISLEDIQSNINNMETFYVEAFFVNTSYHQKNNMIILGTTRNNFEPSERATLSTGIYQGLIVENVTKNWKSPITTVNGVLNSCILENIPSYESNDFFIVYKDPVLIRRESTQKIFVVGLQDYKITSIENKDILQKGQVFTDGNISIEIVNVEPLVSKIVNPGSNVIVNSDIDLSNTNNKITIKTIKTGTGVILTENVIINIEQYLVAILDTLDNSVQYYSIDEIHHNILYLEFKQNNFEDVNIQQIIYCYFVPYQKIFPNVVIPLVPFQNQVCVEARLVSLCLPNLPICGYNIFLADIPYVLVSLCNSEGQGCSIGNTLYSNVPAAANFNFVCPIANVRNRRLNFVSVKGKQEAIFKFSPRDSLKLKISLPNGDILKYATDPYTDVFSCPPLDVPLNQNASSNEKLIYPYKMSNTIAAVFEINFL
jgi:hypothetical protein